MSKIDLLEVNKKLNWCLSLSKNSIIYCEDEVKSFEDIKTLENSFKVIIENLEDIKQMLNM